MLRVSESANCIYAYSSFAQAMESPTAPTTPATPTTQPPTRTLDSILSTKAAYDAFAVLKDALASGRDVPRREQQLVDLLRAKGLELPEPDVVNESTLEQHRATWAKLVSDIMQVVCRCPLEEHVYIHRDHSLKVRASFKHDTPNSWKVILSTDEKDALLMYMADVGAMAAVSASMPGLVDVPLGEPVADGQEPRPTVLGGLMDAFNMEKHADLIAKLNEVIAGVSEARTDEIVEVERRIIVAFDMQAGGHVPASISASGDIVHGTSTSELVEHIGLIESVLCKWAKCPLHGRLQPDFLVTMSGIARAHLQAKDEYVAARRKYMFEGASAFREYLNAMATMHRITYLRDERKSGNHRTTPTRCIRDEMFEQHDPLMKAFWNNMAITPGVDEEDPLPQRRIRAPASRADSRGGDNGTPYYVDPDEFPEVRPVKPRMRRPGEPMDEPAVCLQTTVQRGSQRVIMDEVDEPAICLRTATRKPTNSRMQRMIVGDADEDDDSLFRPVESRASEATSAFQRALSQAPVGINGGVEDDEGDDLLGRHHGRRSAHMPIEQQEIERGFALAAARDKRLESMVAAIDGSDDVTTRPPPQKTVSEYLGGRPLRTLSADMEEDMDVLVHADLVALAEKKDSMPVTGPLETSELTTEEATVAAKLPRAQRLPYVRQPHPDMAPAKKVDPLYAMFIEKLCDEKVVENDETVTGLRAKPTRVNLAWLMARLVGICGNPEWDSCRAGWAMLLRTPKYADKSPTTNVDGDFMLEIDDALFVLDAIGASFPLLAVKKKLMLGEPTPRPDDAGLVTGRVIARYIAFGVIPPGLERTADASVADASAKTPAK
jgi:hypothetical protein